MVKVKTKSKPKPRATVYAAAIIEESGLGFFSMAFHRGHAERLVVSLAERHGRKLDARVMATASAKVGSILGLATKNAAQAAHGAAESKHRRAQESSDEAPAVNWRHGDHATVLLQALNDERFSVKAGAA